jgi:hypothetical protein
VEGANEGRDCADTPSANRSLDLCARYSSGRLHLCSDEVASERVSGSGRYVAALVIRDCGATTDYASHIRLRTVGEPIDLNGKPVAVFEGKIDPPVWLGDQLIVRFGDASRFKTYDRWGDVAIAYAGR